MLGFGRIGTYQMSLFIVMTLNPSRPYYDTILFTDMPLEYVKPMTLI